MITESLIQKIEALRESLEKLKGEIRTKYKSAGSQVDAKGIRKIAAQLSETWMIEISSVPEIEWALDADVWADLTVSFQQLLTCSEHATLRRKYDDVLSDILRDFRARVVVPIKQRARTPFGPTQIARRSAPTSTSLGAANRLFLAHSFADSDAELVELVRRALVALGKVVTSGEKPRAGRISEKVQQRIREADAFVALFTRQIRVAGKREWRTSEWLIDEKAYATALNKPLILLKEAGVRSIGGIHGGDDYEYISFERSATGNLIVRIMEVMQED